MSFDHIANIARAIREALGRPNTCASFEVTGKPDLWVQYHDGAINGAYPHAFVPEALMQNFDNANLEEWEAGKYMTFTITTADPRAIATLVDRYFERVLDAGPTYSLNIGLANL